MEDLYDIIAKGLVDADVFVEGVTGDDLRDILPEAVVNKAAEIVSTAKSAETNKETETVDLETLGDSIPDEVVEFIADLQDQVADLQKSLDEAGIEETDDDIELEKALSSLDPQVAEIFKANQVRLENAEAALAAERQSRVNETYVAKARQYDGIVDNPDEFGPALARIAEIDRDAADLVEKTLASASERVTKGMLFEEVGTSLAPSGGDAYEKATAIAKSMVEAGTADSVEGARAQVWADQPGLYADYLAEEQARKR